MYNNMLRSCYNRGIHVAISWHCYKDKLL